jgi:hypothetical protein
MHSVTASIKLEELEHGNAPEDSVELARRAIRSLAAFLDDFGADKDPTVELKETFEHATVSASAPDVPPQIWSVRAGLFEELRQLANALQSLRDARS